MNDITYKDLRRLILFMIVLYLAFRFIDQVMTILTFFVTAFLIALLLNPAVNWLQSKNIKRLWGSLITVFSAVLIVVLIVSIIVPLLAGEVSELIATVPQISDQLIRGLEQFSDELPFLKNLDQKLDVGKLFSAPETLNTIANAGQNIIGAIFLNALALFIIIYLLINPKPLLMGFFQFLDEKFARRTKNSLVLTSRNLSTWFYSSMLIGIVNGLIVTIALYFLGVDFAIVFGLLLVFAEFVPYVGPLAIGIFAVLFALSDGLVIALIVALVFIAVQSLESIIWGPLILAKSLELHPVSIIFGILIGEAMIGIIGSVLAVPVLIIIKIVFNQFWNPKISDEDLERQANDVMELRAEG